VLVSAAGQTFAFAGTNVQRVVRIGPEDLRGVAGRQMLALGGAPLPVASLAAGLGLAAAAPGREAPAPVLAAGGASTGVRVEELLAEQEIVIKNLGARVRRLRHVSGATLLPTGRIALVLNAANLMRSALSQAGSAGLPARAADTAAPKKRLLVADDSVTTRT